jgi:hypothetical protein
VTPGWILERRKIEPSGERDQSPCGKVSHSSIVNIPSPRRKSGLGYLLMTAIGLDNIQATMSVTLLLVLEAATVNTVLLAQDRKLRNPGG